jgi:hypothetical protein
MNPAVLNHMTRLTVIDGYQVWYFGAATKHTRSPYLVINTEVGNHSWVGWYSIVEWSVGSRNAADFINSHRTLAIVTL